MLTLRLLLSKKLLKSPILIFSRGGGYVAGGGIV